jgi:hypothetical protein
MPWHDVGIRIEGECALDLNLYYLQIVNFLTTGVKK